MMGTFQVYVCDNCNRQIELGGPQEYKKTLFGIKELHHPSCHQKIDGLWLSLWCPKCRKVEKKVMVEFARPSTSLQVWGRTAPIKEQYTIEVPGQYNCEECNTYMIDEIDENTACPFCEKGRLVFSNTIQT